MLIFREASLLGSDRLIRECTAVGTPFYSGNSGELLLGGYVTGGETP